MQQRETVRHAMDGDHDAFSELARSAIVRLDTLARLITRDPETAQDAVQEALVRAWRDLPALREPDRFDAWLRRLLVRACYDEIRRRQRRGALEAKVATTADPTTSDVVEATAERDILARAFGRIGPEHRAVIVLHLYLGLSVPEVAEILSIPVGTAKSRLHRGTHELRAALEAEDRETGSLREATNP